MNRIDTSDNYHTLSFEVGKDNTTQSALKEAWQILEGVKKSGNSELLDKFTKEYIEIYSKIQEAKITENEISISERQEILLELADMVELAQAYQINEYKGSTGFSNAVGNFLKSINPTEVKYQSLSLKDKNIDDYSVDDAMGALKYLNTNYNSYNELSAANEEKINDLVKSTLGYESPNYKINTSSYTSNYQYLQDTNSEFNGFTSVSDNYSNKKLLGLDTTPVRACTEQSFKSSFFGIDESDIKKGLTFNFHTINELDDKYEVRLFQELAIKKVLGLNKETDLEGKGYSDKYIHGFSHEKGGNYLMETQEMDDLLYFETDIREINSKALANYVFYLKEKGLLTPEYLVRNISAKNLMSLGTLWAKDDTSDDGKNRQIAKDTIIAAGGKDFVELVTKFKDIESIKSEFINIVNDKDYNQKLSNLPACYKIFLEKHGAEVTDVFINSLEAKIEEAKQRNPNVQMNAIINQFKESLNKEIKKDVIDIHAILTLINNFSEASQIDLSGVLKGVTDVAKADNDLTKLELIEKQRGLIDEYRLLTTERRSMNRFEYDEAVKLNLEARTEISNKLVLAGINEQQLKIIEQLTDQDLEDFRSNKYSLEEILAKKIEGGNQEIIQIVETQSRLIDSVKESNPEFYKENLETFNTAIGNKTKIKQSYATYYAENISASTTAKTNTSSNTPNNIGAQNIQTGTNYTSYYPEAKINISRGMGGEYYIQSKDEDKKYSITQEESELIENEPEYRENFSNFLETVNELGLEEFWEYRQDLFKTIDNLIGGTAFKEDSEKLNDLDMIRFLSTVVKSYGVQPKNNTLGELKLQVKELNFGSASGSDVVRNSRGESNIFSNFKEKFIDEGTFKQIEFEKYLLNPNSNNKTGIEQQIS